MRPRHESEGSGVPGGSMSARQIGGMVAASCASFLAIYRASGPLLSLLPARRFARLPLEQQIEWRNRVMSLVHACVAGAGSWWLLLRDKSLWREPFHSRSPGTQRLLSVSVGYFAADTIVESLRVAAKGKADALFWQMMAHHGVAMFSYCVSIRLDIVYLFDLIRLRSEVSTVFLNLRHFTRAVDAPPAARILADVALALTFLLFRLCPLPDYYARLVRHWRSFRAPLWVRVLFVFFGFVLDGLNVVWMGRILDAARR